jgi:hypothetical protein
MKCASSRVDITTRQNEAHGYGFPHLTLFSDSRNPYFAEMTRRLAIAVIAACTLATPLILPAHASATTQLDQQTFVDTSRTPPGTLPTSSLSFGQVFTAGITGSLTSASVLLFTLDDRFPPSFAQKIYAVNPGTSLPTGSALTSQAITPGPTAWTWIETPFSTPVNVTAGTQYALVVTSSDGAHTAYWAYGLAYAGGSGVLGASGTWSEITGPNAGDLAFRTYVTTGSPTPTPENGTDNIATGPLPVMQQVGVSDTNTCADVTDSDLTFGSEVHGGWSKSWAQWTNDGAGGSVCTRTLTYEVNTSRWSVG